MLRALADAALAALLAPCCATCNAVLYRPLDGAVCPRCWSRVARFSPPLCAVCGEPLPSQRAAEAAGRRCPVCSVRLGAIHAARAVGPFDGALADIVHALKYARRPSVAGPLAHLMRVAAADLLPDVDLLVPVPLHRRRERARGFNQAEALARALGLPVCLALARPRHTLPQVGLSGPGRHANVRHAFALEPASARVRGRRIALVDDVLTTGATLAACAEVLLQAAPLRIAAVTAARAVTAPRG
jgi:ComF family protein